MGDSVQAPSTVKENGTVKEYDGIVIGAGVAGLYQLHRLRQAGLSVRLYEAGSGVWGYLVLEPLPGVPLRFRERVLRLLVVARAAPGMGLERALFGAAGERALSQFCRR